MTEQITGLIKTDLFQGIEQDQTAALLGCLQARIIRYTEGEFLVEEGGTTKDFGIILSGNARSIRWYAENQPTIITLLKEGNEVGVLIAASFERKSPVSVQAQDDVLVLSIPFARLLSRCNKGCPRHDRLLHNYINIVAQKGLLLHERINCLLKPSIREKVLSYLTRVMQKKQTAGGVQSP